MKRYLFTLITLLAVASLNVLAQEPAWVRQHPVSEESYLGVGMASLSDGDYVRKATESALADLASQIALKVDNKSFLHTVDVDGHSRELFEDKIQKSLTAWLQGQELKDSYRNERNYYVLYALSKKSYARNVEAKRSEVTKQGYHFLQQGQQAEANVDLAQAAQLYAKGLECVEPWLFLNLTQRVDGVEVNVPAELYTALSQVFSGMALTTNVAQVEGESFKAVSTPIAACLSRGGVVVPGVKLVASFVKGSGEVTPAIVTDYNGTSEFYITNITSKESVQELRIAIDDSFVPSLPKAYIHLLQRQSWPSAKVTVALKAAPVMLYLLLKDDMDLEGIEKPIRSLLVNNYFALTDDPDKAQCFVEMESKLALGTVVMGGLTDLNTCLCSLEMKFYNNQTEQLILDYNLSQVRVLVPVNKSAEQGMQMCVREVMKRVNRELPMKLKKLSF